MLVDFLPAENFIFYICRMEWKRKIYKDALLLVKQMVVSPRRALLDMYAGGSYTSLICHVRTEKYSGISDIAIIAFDSSLKGHHGWDIVPSGQVSKAMQTCNNACY